MLEKKFAKRFFNKVFWAELAKSCLFLRINFNELNKQTIFSDKKLGLSDKVKST